MKRLLLIAAAALALPGFAQTPPAPTPAPAPTPRFNTGSALDPMYNRAWELFEEMTDAYEKCDAERFERALDELDRLRQQAKATADAATGAAEFSNVKPAEARSFAETLADQVRQRRYALAALKRECAKEHRPGGIGTILGPRRPDSTATQPPAQGPQGGIGQQPQPPAPTQDPPLFPPPPPAVDAALTANLRHAQATDRCDGPEMNRWLEELERLAREAEREMRRWRGEQTRNTYEEKLREYQEIQKILEAARARQRAPCPKHQLPRIPQYQVEEPRQGTYRLDRASEQLLAAHNRVRAEVGSPPLIWDPQLAAQAASYGPQLAQYGRPVHSSRTGRETSRENLLQALPGTPVEAMVGVWIAERRNFANGIFPDVSLTGNWTDVGHYTQMVWPTTTHIGCAVQRGLGRFDWLICRYSPPGNKDGKPVLSPKPVPVSRNAPAKLAPAKQKPGADGDYCDDGRVVAGEGDCDSNAQCDGGSVCLSDNGGRYAGPGSAGQQDDHCPPGRPADGDCDTNAGGPVCEADTGGRHGPHDGSAPPCPCGTDTGIADCDANDDCRPGLPSTAGSTCTADAGTGFSPPSECTQPAADQRRCPEELQPSPAGQRTALDEIEESDRFIDQQRKAGTKPATPPPSEPPPSPPPPP